MSILSSESDFLHENINNVYYSLKANFYNTIECLFFPSDYKLGLHDQNYLAFKLS